MNTKEGIRKFAHLEGAKYDGKLLYSLCKPKITTDIWLINDIIDEIEDISEDDRNYLKKINFDFFEENMDKFREGCVIDLVDIYPLVREITDFLIQK